MAVLEIDGVGKVEVGPEFARLPPDQQNATVQEIISKIRGDAAPAAASPETGTALQEEARQGLAAQGIQPEGRPGEIVERGAILPFGVDQQGNVSLALPQFLEGPRRTIMDLLEGIRTVKEVSGKEIFELGALFAGGGGAGGTGAGVARASAERLAAQQAERTAGAAMPAPVAQTARLASELAAETPAAAPAAAAVAPTGTAGGTTIMAAGSRVGVPLSAAAIAAEKAATSRGLHSTAETLAMRATAKEGFKALDDAAVVVNPISTGNLTREIFSDAARAGLNETITPMANAAVKQIKSLENEAITLQTLDVMRKVASAAAGSAKAADRNIAEGILTKLDDFVMNLTAKDLQLGTAAEAKNVATTVAAARKTWATMSKLETVARLVQRAEDAVANRPSLGIENSLRTEFIALAKNDRMMRTFTPEERAAIKQISKGATKTFMRGVGRLAPTGPVSGLPTLGATTALGAKVGLDPISSAIVFGPPIAGVTFAARKLAAVLTQRSIKNLETIIKSGGSRVAADGVARGNGVLERLSSQINTAVQAQAVTQPSNPDLVKGLQSAGAYIDPHGGRPPTIGTSLNLAMSAIPGARGLNPNAALKQIDAQIAKIIKGTDWHVMDIGGRSIEQLKSMKDQLPKGVIELAIAREKAVKALDHALGVIDKELKTALKGTGLDPMDVTMRVGMRGIEGLQKIRHLIPDKVWGRVLKLAAQRAKFSG